MVCAYSHHSGNLLILGRTTNSKVDLGEHRFCGFKRPNLNSWKVFIAGCPLLGPGEQPVLSSITRVEHCVEKDTASSSNSPATRPPPTHPRIATFQSPSNNRLLSQVPKPYIFLRDHGCHIDHPCICCRKRQQLAYF